MMLRRFFQSSIGQGFIATSIILGVVGMLGALTLMLPSP